MVLESKSENSDAAVAMCANQDCACEAIQMVLEVASNQG